MALMAKIQTHTRLKKERKKEKEKKKLCVYVCV